MPLQEDRALLAIGCLQCPPTDRAPLLGMEAIRHGLLHDAIGPAFAGEFFEDWLRDDLPITAA